MYFKDKNKQTYYVCTHLIKNETIICVSMQCIASYLEINTKTISRHMGKNTYWRTDEYIICRDISIKRIRRGFAL